MELFPKKDTTIWNGAYLMIHTWWLQNLLEQLNSKGGVFS
jgi:hypothetical protein